MLMQKVVPLDDNLSNHVPDHMKQYGVLTSNPLLKAGNQFHF